jgi:hypothetical protein
VGSPAAYAKFGNKVRVKTEQWRIPVRQARDAELPSRPVVLLNVGFLFGWLELKPIQLDEAMMCSPLMTRKNRKQTTPVRFFALCGD